VAYKGNVADARETPAKALINILKEKVPSFMPMIQQHTNGGN